ncbi:MAG: hypothetical protein GXZ04_05530 [Clostridiales bacterium]|nr:hypothetical protein [Clostridiales bacterium]
MSIYINQAIEPTIQQISSTFPVLLLTGPRRVGKTTMLRRLAEQGRRYVSLKTSVGTGKMLCMASDVIPFDQKNWFVPAWVV